MRYVPAVESRPLPEPDYGEAYGQADLPRGPRREHQAQAYAPPPPPRYDSRPPRSEERQTYAPPRRDPHSSRDEERQVYAPPPPPRYGAHPQGAEERRAEERRGEQRRGDERQAYAPPPPQRYDARPWHRGEDRRGEERQVYAPPRPAEYSSQPPGGARLSHAAAPRTQPPRSASADARARPSAALPAAGTGQTLLPTPPVYTVASGDTLGRVAQMYHVTPHEIAVANGMADETPLRVGSRLTIPIRTVTFRPARPQPAAPATAQARAGEPRAPVPPAPQPSVRVAASEAPAANVRMMAPVPPVEAAPAVPAGPAFRWPARGRIINNYGARVNGSTNDGIDLAMPEGTQVRAADDGVVAYAGNELKGYGNLVLVRHANGFVTAYANGSELLVRRNDQVHKGQVIMKSGQTGNATTPQLHFEIRKNSAPVDPMQYLPTDRTASAPL
jgi:murein DD-endopeptidase MepM/ murein hydrolase activator NlpD